MVPDFTELCGSINDGPEQYIVRAAFAALNAWVVERQAAAARARRSKVDGGAAIARDAHGNAIGGIRTPAVDVPTEIAVGRVRRRQAA